MQIEQVIKDKNENIEILRAIAVILVLFVHLRAILFFPSSLYDVLTSHFDGNVGVDLFFVISGFVITQTLTRSFSYDKASQLYLIIVFWIKRIFRLLPVALFWLCIVVLFLGITGDFWDGHHLQLRNLIPIGAAILNVFNFYNAYCVANPADLNLCNAVFFNGHYWSLSLEAQFYIIFPFLLFFLRKRSLILLLTMIIAALFFWCRPYWSYGWFFRIDGFCWGILLSILSIKDTKVLGLDKILRSKKTTSIFFWGLVFLLPFSSTLVQGFGQNAKTYGVSLMAVISAGLVLVALRKENFMDAWPIVRKSMLYIGSRSYSIYVSHLIIFIFIMHIWKTIVGDFQNSIAAKSAVNLTVVVFALLIVFFLSEITYRFIEVKFRLKGRKIAGDYLQTRI